jgi:hypothetical protein
MTAASEQLGKHVLAPTDTNATNRGTVGNGVLYSVRASLKGFVAKTNRLAVKRES